MKTIINKDGFTTISKLNIEQITFVNGNLIVIYEDGTTSSFSKESLGNGVLNIVDNF